MEQFAKRFKIECSPVAAQKQTIVRGGTRLTVITPCMLRVENQAEGKFCDEPTQSVWFRDFCKTDFEVSENKGNIEIKTSKATFVYSLRSKKMLRILLADGRKVTNYKAGNLKGTCRTLDITAGIITLNDGVCSRGGVAVLDDGKTLAIKPDGSILPRENSESDKYYFAYGNDYIGATTDLYKLTGKVPLIPRYALSNWWSRYKAYSQQEYLDLMDRFKDEEIPITVATVDMDWHWVDIKSKFGKDAHKVTKHLNFMEYVYDVWSVGWTGYSFNTDLFPDPDGFIKKLKDDKYHVTFNIHPSMGVRWFEDQYEDMCKAMGQNPAEKKPVAFDITDKKFTEKYFDILHRPFEEKGVDFWWIDWQQGTNTAVKGLDPLWALNHYHFLDNAKDNHRPLILSRFCGAGSQRYPLGFSGDTTQTWKSLDFQPGFTATASNIAYPWWSHDIGGHCMGKKDDELYLRWVQLGIFSPVMRLHSTNNEFAGKEPWNYSGPVERIAKDALRLRHKLLPYIYTMNYRTHTECRAICEPMYYAYPEDENSYNCKNEFFFGTELIVAPITEHTSLRTNLAGVNVWIPEGRYTDIFTGRIYKGNKFVKMFRDIETIPVLAKEGAIIPMSVNDRINDCSNPKELELWVYRGNNTFTLYEDDGDTLSYQNGEYLKTAFTVAESSNKVTFSISKAEGDASVVPEERTYTVKFKDIVSGNVTVNGADAVVNNCGTLEVTFTAKADATVEITLENCDYLRNGEMKPMLTNVISKFQMSTDKKGMVYNSFIQNKKSVPNVAKCFKEPIEEIMNLHR
ncbi:MAG: glycoside hydrolase family 31 protein [Acutalibacteraceae bacterium]|nr:glycoside hydrolase family 31 protein [Acutalibacteraceae bacterium]